MPSWTIPSVFGEMCHKYVGFREFAASVGHPKAERFSASGGFAPVTPDP